MTLLAIDPGTAESAFVELISGVSVGAFGKIANQRMLEMVQNRDPFSGDVLVVEMIASYGMAVGAEVFETCVWIGRFLQAWPCDRVDRLFRKDVVAHMCGSARGKDANVRQALIDRWGGKDKAIGRKTGKTNGVANTTGPLYGISDDVWQALAVAVTWIDRYGRSAA